VFDRHQHSRQDRKLGDWRLHIDHSVGRTQLRHRLFEPKIQRIICEGNLNRFSKYLTILYGDIIIFLPLNRFPEISCGWSQIPFRGCRVKYQTLPVIRSLVRGSVRTVKLERLKRKYRSVCTRYNIRKKPMFLLLHVASRDGIGIVNAFLF
jgi:hypothetical protein